MHQKTSIYIILITAFLMALATGCKKNPVNSSGSSSSHSPYGFVGNGKVDNTQRIQTVIDSTSKAGGGTIVFYQGKYLTGPITLKSNVTIALRKGAIIEGTTDEKAYYPAGADTSGPIPSSLQPLINADHANNIKITGQGTINGNGREWWQLYTNAKNNNQTPLPGRPRLIELDHTTNIVIDSVHIENAPMFNIAMGHCRNVKIENTNITAPASSPNTDGIDPGDCHNVTITNNYISNGDDNVAIGSHDPTSVCSLIYIKNNKFGTGHGVSIGSYTIGGVDSVYVENNTFNGTTNGFRIKTTRQRGGNVRNVLYNNNTMTNVEYPIFFTDYYPNIPFSDAPQPITKTTPYIHDITIENLKSTINSQYGGTPKGGLIVGLPEKHMNNITLKNVDIEVQNVAGSSGLQLRNATIDTSNVNIQVAPIQVTASDEALTGLTAGYEMPASGTTKEVQKVQPDASTSGSSGTNTWPAESSKNSKRYVEFAMAPKGVSPNGTKYSLSVDSLSMSIGSKGASGMHAAVYYAVGSSYSNPTQVANMSSLPENMVKDTSMTGENTSYLNVSVPAGEKLFVRVYPWLPGGTTSTTKYMYIGNVRVYAQVQYPTASGSMIWPLTNISKQKASPLDGSFILQSGAVIN